jgi:putative membrane protein insertion efficiency factor
MANRAAGAGVFSFLRGSDLRLMNPLQHILILLVRVYRVTLSPLKTALFGPAGECRFEPSCSQYALDAVKTHGAVSGGWLATKRICRCHPWGACGKDPVPPRVQPSKLRAIGSELRA